jgi:hypothetical protein
MSISLSKEHRDYMWLDWVQAIELATHDETKGVITNAHNFMQSAGLD